VVALIIANSGLPAACKHPGNYFPGPEKLHTTFGGPYNAFKKKLWHRTSLYLIIRQTENARRAG
jgi:hypothetical protein